MFLHKKKKFVIVSMSGGVDSTISAFLLKKAGYHVEGVFMKNWNKEDNNNYCNSEEDLIYAKLVSKKLKIKLNTINFSNYYWEKIFKVVLKEYKKGLTPNPDILCNKYIKFNLFIKYSIKHLGADYVSTGHYIRKIYSNNNNYLLKALDDYNDQSYFLYSINSKNIEYCLFPLGWIYKYHVRNIAKKLNLENFNRKPSTGICFIGKRNFKKFLNKFIPFNKGKIYTINNIFVGLHDGLPFYTLGQRYGLKIGGIKNLPSKPWYIIKKDINNNIIYVSQNINNNYLNKKIIINSVNWINNIPKSIKKFTVKSKIRYSKEEFDTSIFLLKDKSKVLIEFNNLNKIIVPGQSVVFYINKYCIGGGIIS